MAIKKFRIDITHFYSFDYYEGDKKMVFELDFRDKILHLDVDLITKWEPPFEDLILSHEEKLQILHNIRECLIKLRKPKHVIIDDPPIIY